MKIEFTITERRGKKALWVNDRNIWDLTSSELTEDVKSAVIMAFHVGTELAKEEMDKIDFGFKFTQEFKEVKKNDLSMQTKVCIL